MGQHVKKRWWVYILCDPRTGECRYVGQTSDLVCRFKQHCRAKGRTHTVNLVQSLAKEGLVPDFLPQVVVETEREAKRIEIALMASWRARGAQLTNHTDGGDGTCGFTHRPDSIAKIRASNKKVYDEHPEKRAEVSLRMKTMLADPDKRASYGDHRRGKKFSDESKAKMRAAKLGKKQPPELIEKRTEGLRKRATSLTPEQRKQMSTAASAARLGSRHTDATKQRISAKISALMTPEHRADISVWTKRGMNPISSET